MKKIKYGLVLCLAIVILTPGCSSKPKGAVIAQVNDDYLTKDEFTALVPQGYDVNQQNLPKILDRWVSNSLMYQEAVRRGLNKDENVKLYLKRLERDYLVNELLGKLTSSVSVSQVELSNYYNIHKDEFSYEVKMMRIVLRDSLFAAKTLEEIRSGADFKKLAKERSEDALLEGGQESRYFARGVGDPRMGGEPDVEEAIFALKKGEVSNVIPSQEGYQIIKLVDKKKVKGEVGLGEVKDYIEAVLAYRKKQVLIDRMLTSLRENAKIELKPDAYFQ